MYNRKTREFFQSVSFGLYHRTSGSDQGGRETCQAGWGTPSGVRQAGGSRVCKEPLCLPIRPCLSSSLCLCHFSASYVSHADTNNLS